MYQGYGNDIMTVPAVQASTVIPLTGAVAVPSTAPQTTTASAFLQAQAAAAQQQQSAASYPQQSASYPQQSALPPPPDGRPSNGIAPEHAVPPQPGVTTPTSGKEPGVMDKAKAWWDKQSTGVKVAVGVGGAALVVGVLYAIFSPGRYTPNRPAKKRKKRWSQKASKKIAKKGTEGSFTRQARAAGYDNTLTYARAVMKGWRDGSKTVRSKSTGKSQRITKRTMQRANFALNVQPRKRRRPR